MRHRLAELIDNHGIKHWSFAARKDPSFLDWVSAETAHLPADIAFAERVYAAVSGISPICERGGRRSLKNITEGWRFCGRAAKCPCAAESVSNNVKAAMALVGEQQQAKTNERRAVTLKERYGVENAARLPQAVEAHRAFYANPTLVAGATAKGRQSMLANHGVDNALKLPKVDVIRRNLAAELGPERRAQAAAKRVALARQGNLLNHGFRKLTERCSVAGFNMVTSRRDYLGVGGYGNPIRYKFQCQRCALHFQDYVCGGNTPACPSCDKPKVRYVSGEENDVASFVLSLDVSVVRTTRKLVRGIELDIAIPSLKLAIEYCGLYWHSELGGGRLPTSHITKVEACEASGYRLVTIFSDEWIDRREVCERTLSRLIARNVPKINADETVVRSVQPGKAIDFLTQNHIEGHDPAASVHLGLWCSKTLVGIMSFRQMPPPVPKVRIRGTFRDMRYIPKSFMARLNCSTSSNSDTRPKP